MYLTKRIKSLDVLKDRLHGKILKHTVLDEETECWVWRGYRQKGTALLKVGSRQYTSPRIAAWVYLGGFDLHDRNVVVRHTAECPYQTCCNYEHLMVSRN